VLCTDADKPITSKTYHMPILIPTDLQTNLYREVIEEISRGDDTIAEKAIASAVSEAKMYLSRYDLLKLFGDAHADPVIEDEYLKSLVKSIACWHLFRTAYTDAVSALKSIMSGQAQPEGWPYAEAADTELPDSNSVSWQSNKRRNNYY
jgi:hypothetical protein